jgi:hypothetical protein
MTDWTKFGAWATGLIVSFAVWTMLAVTVLG